LETSDVIQPDDLRAPAAAWKRSVENWQPFEKNTASVVPMACIVGFRAAAFLCGTVKAVSSAVQLEYGY